MVSTSENRPFGRGPTGVSRRGSRARQGLCLLLLTSWPFLAEGFSEYAKTSIAFPDDPFAVASATGKPGWVKFTILIDDPGTVIFQDSNTYPFHYDFAVNELPAFAGMTPEQFDQVTLYEAGQMAILGAVILPPLVGIDHVFPEYGIQLVRQDPYDPVTVVSLFDLVKSVVVAAPNVEAFYFPTFEQRESAEQNLEFLASQGVIVSSPGRWATGNACYSTGWALGELKYFEGGQIDAAYLNGSLLPGDVLLTDAVPAEIPFVAGVMSLSPSTPASHVAILAETFGVPFAHLALADDAARAQALVGHDVVLRVEDDYGECRVRLIDVESVLDPSTIAEILALKTPAPLDIPAMQPYGAYSASTAGLQPADILYFGGKAANFGLLRQAIPANSPVAVAFSFDLWNAFMDRSMPGGTTLREIVDEQLAPYAYPPDIQALSATLSGIRDLIKDDGETSFPPAAESAVIAALQDPQYGFDPNLKLRFRSSTNVEDSDRFSGAGLYDSYSGCLADDLDGGSGGPSHCDPTQSSERGVFRAIRKVFASFYNLNAYLERLRHGIDEDQVGMALLVHHSFPDESELANGVAVHEPHTYSDDIYLVTQDGSSSVTNPEPGAVPEEVDVWVSRTSGNAWPTVMAYSNLVPLGSTVMDFPQDYQELSLLLVPVADAYGQATGATGYKLEYEYKKLAPQGDLIVKQVRRIPQADTTPSITPFLINEPAAYCLVQGEAGDVFANHRLKSRWSFETRNMWLTEENLQQSLYADVTLEYAEACQLYGQTGPLPDWPEATHGFAGGTATDGWRFGNLQNPRAYELTTDYIPTLVAPSQSPLLTLSDLGGGCLWLRVDYDDAVPSIDFNGPIMTTTEYAMLCACPEPQIGDKLQQRVLEVPGVVTVDTTFYWPPDPMMDAGYTAPLVRWVETVIYGLTTDPVVLHGDYSQTYRPEHHNFGEHYIFDPAQEPGISGQQLGELAAAGVRVIHAYFGYLEPEFVYYDDPAWGDPCLDCTGFDGDEDGFCTGEPTFDCDDARGDVWATPGDVPRLDFTGDSTLAWSEPLEPGGTMLLYDTLRSSDPADYVTGAVCVEFDEGSDREATDTDVPASGDVFHYLVRAQNDCPEGQGPLGQDSNGTDRQARPCP
jgi:hypothetical protein